jgi:hypothetical protein
MGAGVSVDDEGDLKKVFEKQKADGTINEEQAAGLQAEYDAIKADPKKGKNEFLVIGKCKKKYEELMGSDGGGGGGGAAAKAARATAPPPAAKPFPTPPEDFTCKAGPNPMILVKMTEIEGAIKKAKEAGLTPLIIDRSEQHLMDSFYGYSSEVIDIKKMGLDVSLRKQPIEEVMDDTRSNIVRSMKNGRTCVFACQTAAVDFVGKFNDEKSGVDLSGKAFANCKSDTKALMPAEILIDSGKALQDESVAEKLFRDADLTSGFADTSRLKDWSIVVTTHFSYEDLDDFMFSGDFGMPLGKFQPIWIAHEEGTAPLD